MLKFLGDNAAAISAACAVLVASGAAIAAVLRLWGLIRDKFDAQDEQRRGEFASMRQIMRSEFAAHEATNLNRHEANLRKFADIRVALTALGWRNGTGHVDHGDDKD